MSLTGMTARTVVVQTIRDVLIRAGYQECIPQLMTATAPREPAIYPFATTWNRYQGKDILETKRYLATSPEHGLKQMIAAGLQTHCFAISHAFRNLEGEGEYHQPEFIMAEWYRNHASWNELIPELEQLVQIIWNKFPSTNLKLTSSPWPHLSLKHLWNTHETIEYKTVIDSDELLSQYAKSKGYVTQAANWEQLFYQIVFNDIEPHFPKHPFFLIDYPKRISPLAKPQTNTPWLAERFELFIGGVEVANGNAENTDIRALQDIIDTDLIESLQKIDSQTWAGVGLGVDRIAMMVSNAATVREVQTP